MANNKIQFKRTSTSGLLPNTTNSANASFISAGEFAVNLTDKKVITSDGSLTFEVGANVINQNVTNALTVNGTVTFANSTANTLNIYANGQILAPLFTGNVTGTASNASALSSVTLATIQSQITGNAATAYTNAIAIAANATNLTSGTVAAARLASGTANSTTILYGNNVWAAAPGSSNAATQSSYSYTLSGNATIIQGADDNAAVLGYTAGLESVFINGSRQISGADYTTTNATAITLTSNVVAGEVVNIIAWSGSTTLPVNTAAQYAWSNTQTFDRLITFSNSIYLSSGGDVIISSATGGANSSIYNDAGDLFLTTNNTVRQYIASNGNVGIGVTAPASKFEVAGTVRIKSANADTNGLNLSSDAGGIGYINAGYATVGQLVFQTQGTEAMRIDSSRNVGIGGSPNFKLDTIGNANSSVIIRGYNSNAGSSATAGIQLQTSTVTGLQLATQSGYISGTTTAHPVNIYANNTGVAIFAANGNVGIGNTTPADKLSVNGTTVLGGTLAAGNTTITGFANVSVSVNTALLSVGTSFTANATRVVIGTSTALQANGGIGTAYQILHSNGTTDYWENQALRSSGQQVISTTQTLGASNYGTNILVTTGGITVTLPTSSSIPSGMGIAIKNVSGANIAISYAHAGDGQTNIQNNQAAVWFADGGTSTYWRQYFLSTNA